MSASTTTTMGLTALVLGLGVFLGATLFSDGSESAGDPGRGAALVREPSATGEPPAGEVILGGRSAGDAAEVAALRTRVEALEREVEALRAQREALEPMVELAGRLQEMGIDGGALPGDVAVPLGGGPVIREGAGQVADLLGLEAGRAQAMEAEVEAIQEQLRQLESEHAEVEENGDIVTITIPAFGDEATALQRRWEDWLAANLTPGERSKYERHGMDGAIWENRFGGYDRTISIRTTPDGIQLTEQGTSDGGSYSTSSSGPHQARDGLLEPYAHLLPDR